MSSVADAIVEGARSESDVWARSLRAEPDWEAVFSPLAPETFALGLETVYEAYLVHYGSGRLFDAPDRNEAVLLGDYLYAHGLVRIAAVGGVRAVDAMSQLISRCAALRAAGAAGDADAWIDAVRALGGDPGDSDITSAVARHTARLAP
ncbi:MAG TPA: hypothetical protein VGU02_07960 [Gaiellaceae bacterium]|nr:hypothetical protein [Gaiellaceae bacterium]